MTSDRIFVYLQLPGSLEVVTAAYYQLEPGDGIPKGTFGYGSSYLARAEAVPLEPFELPLSSRKFTTAKL